METMLVYEWIHMSSEAMHSTEFEIEKARVGERMNGCNRERKREKKEKCRLTWMSVGSR